MKLQIKTTYIGPTDTKGSKIRASFNGKSLTIPYDYSLNSYELHFKAARLFAEKHGFILGDEDSHEKGWNFAILGLN